MKKDLLAAAFIAVTLCLAAYGCRNRTAEAPTPGSPRSITAVSGGVTVEHLRVLPWCGALLVVAGIVGAACSRYRAAIFFFVGGAGMVALYVAASEYPWSIAWFPMALCLAFCAALVVWVVERRKRMDATTTLKEAVRVIQPHDELKKEMGGGDPKKQDEYRKVIDPLKTEMREEGII